MKKRLAVWVFFIMLSLALSLEPSFAPGLASGLMAQPGLGAASMAKGGVSLGEGDPLWALWNDPSGLIGAGMGSVGELAKTTHAWNGLGFMVHRPFGLAELDQRVLSAVWSPRHYSDTVRTKAWGVGLYDSGDELFRESKLRLGWAAGIMIVLRVIGYSSSIETIDWRIILAIAASLGLGGALQATGVAELIAEKGFSSTATQPYLALVITYFVTWGLTELITNNAAAVLIFPLALAISQQLGVDFAPFAFTIIMAASASFSTPMGYQTNLMIYGPGNYRYTDFLKVGLPLNLIIAALTLFLVPKIWAF